MYATNNQDAESMSTVPDTCNTLVPSVPAPVTVPTPYVNMTKSSDHLPSVFNVTIGGGLAENLLTMGQSSTGDELGALGGIISGVFIDADMYVMGSLKVMFGVAFAARLNSLTGMNGMPYNTTGLCIKAGQSTVSVKA